MAVQRDDSGTWSYVHGLNFRIGYEQIFTIPTALGGALTELHPVCVIAAGFGPNALVTARWCHKAGVPRVIFSGDWLGQKTAIGPLRTTMRRWLVRGASAFIAYGTAAAEYLVTLGATSANVFRAFNTVDLEKISAEAHDASTRRCELAAKYRLADKNLLFVGSLVERKGLRELVSAALTVQPTGVDWALHLVGDGPLRQELEAKVASEGSEANFRFHGLRTESEVADLLGTADSLLLPAKREAWGLVINEAMACGVPVITSPWAGATRDLIEDGYTGYVVEPTDTLSLAEVMARVIRGDAQCAQVGRNGAETIRTIASLEKSAEGWMSAIRYAIQVGPRA